MFPYGIVIKQNRLALQQSVTIWQRKFGILKIGKFLLNSVLPALIFSFIYAAAVFVLDKDPSVTGIIYAAVIYLIFLVLYMYLTAMRSAKDFAASSKDVRMQLVLKEEVLEITTEFSKEVIPYREIDLCYEKDFLVTLIFDKNSFPVAISKVLFEKGNYEMFVSLLKSKIPDRYEKRGEN